MGNCTSNNNLVNESSSKKKFRETSAIINNEDKIIFEIKCANDKLKKKSKKLNDNINKLKINAKEKLNEGDKLNAKLNLAKKKILEKSLKKMHLQQILLDKRVIDIKQSKSDKELQKIIKDSNKCLEEINNELSNETYLEAVELLAENDRLNDEAIVILKNNDIDIENELNELNKYDSFNIIKDLSDSNIHEDKKKRESNVEMLI